MPVFAVVLNPYASGNRRARKRVERFSAIVGDDGVVIATRDLGHLRDSLAEFHEAGTEILAVCGGDGSFFRAVSLAIQIWGEDPLPLMLPLRAGTINNLSRTIGARRRRPESLLAHVVKDYRQGRTHQITERELMCVNGDNYGYIVGAGLIVNFLRLYYSGRRPGPVRAFYLLIRLALSKLFGTTLIKGVVQPFEADVICDDERLPFRSFTLLLASTVEHIGLGVKPFYLSARKRGYFHFLAGPATTWQLLGRLPRFFRGFPAGLDTLYDNMGTEVRVEFAAPRSFTVNGDLLGPVSVLEIEAGPRVSFICG